MASSHYQTFRDMAVWQQSFDFAKGVMRLNKSLSTEEQSNVSSSLCKTALSMPAHIAIGQATRGRGDFVKHLAITQGNAAECETYLLLLQDMHPELAEEAGQLREINAVVQKMLGALIYAIEHPKNARNDKSFSKTENTEPVCVPVAA